MTRLECGQSYSASWTNPAVAKWRSKAKACAMPHSRSSAEDLDLVVGLACHYFVKDTLTNG
jgi:hypothetical protein